MPQMIVIKTSLIDLEKFTISGILALKQDEMKQKPIPTREECESEEEYQLLFKEYMLDAVDFAEKTKKEVFVQDLEKYNDFLTKKHQAESEMQDLRKEHISEINRNTKRKSYIFIAELITTLLLPQYFPIIIGVGFAQLLSSNTLIKYHLKELENEESIKDNIKQIQIELSNLSFQLRDDYHQSKEEFKKLKERALRGENILEDALSMISPERLSLPRVNVKIEELENPNEIGPKPKVVHLINPKDKKEVTM